MLTTAFVVIYTVLGLFISTFKLATVIAITVAYPVQLLAFPLFCFYFAMKVMQLSINMNVLGESHE